jgi:hypothetical protein
LIRRLVLAIVVAAIAPIAPRADERAGSKEAFGAADVEDVVRLLEAKNCDQAWRVLWNAAVAGSNGASATLVWEASYGRLVPPFAPMTEPEDPSQLDPAWKQMMSFLADVAFTLQPEQFSADEDEQERAFEFKGAVLENSWSSSSFQRYKAYGCLAAGASKACTDPGAWSSDVRDLAHWDATWRNGKTPRAVASCKDAWHAYRETLPVE